MSKIKDIKLLKAEINIMRNMPKQCELKVKRKAQISAPKEEGDRTALLNLGLSVETIETRTTNDTVVTEKPGKRGKDHEKKWKTEYHLYGRDGIINCDHFNYGFYPYRLH